MRITADTNVLVRLIMADDEAQGRLAIEAMEKADLVAIGVHSLCEFCWVLSRHYAVADGDIAAAIRGFATARNVVINRPAVDAGLLMLDAGGDFADGVIAHEGKWLGGDRFVSFDKKAVKRLAANGMAADLLG